MVHFRRSWAGSCRGNVNLWPTFSVSSIHVTYFYQLLTFRPLTSLAVCACACVCGREWAWVGVCVWIPASWCIQAVGYIHVCLHVISIWNICGIIKNEYRCENWLRCFSQNWPKFRDEISPADFFTTTLVDESLVFRWSISEVDAWWLTSASGG